MARSSLSPEQLRLAAQVAKAEGVTITIEVGARVYRIAPGSDTAHAGEQAPHPVSPYEEWKRARAASGSS